MSIRKCKAKVFEKLQKTGQFLIVLLMLLVFPILSSGCIEQMAPSKHFKPAGSLAEGLDNPTATLLPNGKIAVLGGSSPDWTYNHRSAEIFDPKSKWSDYIKPLPIDRNTHRATLRAIS